MTIIDEQLSVKFSVELDSSNEKNTLKSLDFVVVLQVVLVFFCKKAFEMNA